MSRSIRGLAIAAGLLGGSAILLVSLIQRAVPGYGASFLQVMSSVYPGFRASGGLGDLMIGTADGLVDGAIAGLLFGFLYTFFGRRRRET